MQFTSGEGNLYKTDTGVGLGLRPRFQWKGHSGRKKYKKEGYPSLGEKWDSEGGLSVTTFQKKLYSIWM